MANITTIVRNGQTLYQTPDGRTWSTKANAENYLKNSSSNTSSTNTTSSSSNPYSVGTIQPMQGSSFRNGERAYTYKGNMYSFDEANKLMQLDMQRAAMWDAQKAQEKALSQLQSSSTYASPSSTYAQPTTGYTSTSGTTTGSTTGTTSGGTSTPSSFKTPYGTLSLNNGEWTLQESPEVKAAREQVATLQQNLISQLSSVPSSEQYKQDYIKANMPEAERLLAQQMASRGLLNSSAFGSGAANLATQMTNAANLSADQYRQNQINALLSQLSGTGSIQGQQQTNANNLSSLGLNAYNTGQSNALNWAQLGQQNTQFNQSQQQQANQFGQTLAQRQAESARDYGLSQANLLSSIFSKGSLF